MIDLVQLRTFVAVAEERHLTRAAERLHISLSAASAHVRAVESTLDTQLFVRASRRLELTRAGELLLGRAKAVLNEATLFSSFARELGGKVEGRIVVASSSDPSASRIGEVASALRERHPLVSVDLRARPSSGAREGLKTGELDIALLLGRPTDTSFSCYELQTFAFRVAGPPAWKQRIEEADWAALAALPWVTPTEGSAAYTTMLQQMFGERGLVLNSVATFDNALLGRAMLEAGVGLDLVREDYALQAERQGSVVLSPLAHAQYPSYLAHLASRRDDPLIRAFLEATTDVWPDLRLAKPLA
ncbi:DNA-binding transcriptional regulator, LysR family [Variovorax sp. CF079]|uniref:LysR family transcriptional regulator n=1 Tax=Variovorax sp. CF079 TaxID=1882774 RepID=UPI00087F3D47|nr:LysR family transcriptional regulator [Variovorax sp. CF079]SDE80304.1 DNA-binding transcriptional regulator, LysR family [Variovorax sp. CF079]